MKTNKQIKMNQEIEDKCWAYLENGMRTKCYEYLKKLGFSNDDIDYFIEVWTNGKSLYPYGDIQD
jgi:hypothetical protein